MSLFDPARKARSPPCRLGPARPSVLSPWKPRRRTVCLERLDRVFHHLGILFSRWFGLFLLPQKNIFHDFGMVCWQMSSRWLEFIWWFVLHDVYHELWRYSCSTFFRFLGDVCHVWLNQRFLGWLLLFFFQVSEKANATNVTLCFFIVSYFAPCFFSDWKPSLLEAAKRTIHSANCSGMLKASWKRFDPWFCGINENLCKFMESRSCLQYNIYNVWPTQSPKGCTNFADFTGQVQSIQKKKNTARGVCRFGFDHIVELVLNGKHRKIRWPGKMLVSLPHVLNTEDNKDHGQNILKRTHPFGSSSSDVAQVLARSNVPTTRPVCFTVAGCSCHTLHGSAKRRETPCCVLSKAPLDGAGPGPLQGRVGSHLWSHRAEVMSNRRHNHSLFGLDQLEAKPTHEALSNSRVPSWVSISSFSLRRFLKRLQDSGTKVFRKHCPIVRNIHLGNKTDIYKKSSGFSLRKLRTVDSRND